MASSGSLDESNVFVRRATVAADGVFLSPRKKRCAERGADGQLPTLVALARRVVADAAVSRPQVLRALWRLPNELLADGELLCRLSSKQLLEAEAAALRAGRTLSNTNTLWRKHCDRDFGVVAKPADQTWRMLYDTLYRKEQQKLASFRARAQQ